MIEGVYILISLIIFLVLISAFLSAAEVVYSSTRDELIRKTKKEDLLYDILVHPERFFSVILVLDNLSNIVLTAIITYKTMEVFGEIALPVSTVLVSVLVILFGEILPKTFAVNYRTELSRFVLVISAYIVRVMSFVYLPVSRLFGKIVEEEIKRQASYFEHVTPEQMKMLKGVMKLRDLELRDILVPRHLSVVLNTEMDMGEVISTIEKTKHTRYPVMSDGRIIGILLSKNLLCSFYDFIKGKDEKSAVRLKDILDVNPELLRPPRFASPSKSALEQLIDFRKWATHIVCVIDDFGEFLGIVTLEDIVEEIIGELRDEFMAGKNFWKDGEYIYARGSTPIRDINREFETDIDEKFETVASTIISVLGRIPENGEKINFNGWEIELLDVSKNKINMIRMRRSSS